MRALRVAGALAALVAVPAATSLAQSSPTYVASSSRADSSGATLATPPSDSLGSAGTRGDRVGSLAMMRDANSRVSQRTDDTTAYENVVGAIRVQAVGDGAGYIVLDDGTRWKVALSDRPRVEQWKAGDYVIVRFAPIAERPDYQYRLINGRDESDVLVAFRGIDQPTD
ncbi:MAG TPA: hypothetical protein VFW04_07890 [Gemmatimonadaceae bacterium]|nr:hypothetical protein [Gemmatimonadaceae bacterium]